MWNNNQIKADVRLGGDPEMRYTTNGIEYAVCSAAIPIGKKDEGKEPIWMGLKAWKYNAEVLASLSKGDALRVDGYLDEERWEKDGVQHSRLVIVCNAITKTIFKKKKKDSAHHEPEPEHLSGAEDGKIPI